MGSGVFAAVVVEIGIALMAAAVGQHWRRQYAVGDLVASSAKIPDPTQLSEQTGRNDP